MLGRRLDDHIRELCTAAVHADTPEKSKEVLWELRQSIHEYTRRLRNRAVAMIGVPKLLPRERRRT